MAVTEKCASVNQVSKQSSKKPLKKAGKPGYELSVQIICNPWDHKAVRRQKDVVMRSNATVELGECSDLKAQDHEKTDKYKL